MLCWVSLLCKILFLHLNLFLKPNKLPIYLFNKHLSRAYRFPRVWRYKLDLPLYSRSSFPFITCPCPSHSRNTYPARWGCSKQSQIQALTVDFLLSSSLWSLAFAGDILEPSFYLLYWKLTEFTRFSYFNKGERPLLKDRICRFPPEVRLSTPKTFLLILLLILCITSSISSTAKFY